MKTKQKNESRLPIFLDVTSTFYIDIYQTTFPINATKVLKIFLVKRKSNFFFVQSGIKKKHEYKIEYTNLLKYIFLIIFVLHLQINKNDDLAKYAFEYFLFLLDCSIQWNRFN